MTEMHRTKPFYIKNNPIYSQTWTDIYEKDLDALIAVCGRRGHCKSGCALTFGEQFDLAYDGTTRFSEDNVFFKATEFMDAMREKHPAGTVFVWDEIGVENDSRSWYTVKNKFMKYVMETNRYKNYVVLVTTPTLKSMDIATQRLLSGYIQMYGKVGDGKQAKGKFEFVETNPKTGKPYFKKPRYLLGGRLTILDEFVIPKPSPGLEEKYKAKKKNYTDNLYSTLNSELEFMSNCLGTSTMQKSQRKTKEDCEAEILNNLKKFVDEETGGFVPATIMQELLGVPYYLVQQVRRGLAWKVKKGVIHI